MTYIVLRFYQSLESTRRVRVGGDAVTTKMGPNDARRIVWALGMCLFFSLRVFFFIDVFLVVGHPFHLRIPGTGPKRLHRCVVWALDFILFSV